MPKPVNDKRPLITAALVTSGSVLAASGLAMMSWPAAPLVAKGWHLIGITGKGVGTVHQVAAATFLGSAGIHIFDRRRAVARHLKAAAGTLLPAKAAREQRSHAST